jgi:Phage tail baseplate hub (GPD)
MAHHAALLVNGSADDALTAAATIEVDEWLDAPARYAVRLPAAIADGDLPLLVDDRIGPGSELAVVAEHGLARECLVWGPVTGQRIELVHGGEGSAVTVDGADAAVAMDREDKAEVWTDTTDSGVVESIAARNALSPDVESTSTSHAEDDHALVQRETDLAMVRRLARRNGYAWWVTATEEGLATLHFKSAPVDDPPAGELAINLADPAVERLEIIWDAERPTSAGAMQLDPRSKEVIDGTSSSSPLNSLGASGFDAIGTRTAWVAAAADDVADLEGRTGAVLADGSFFARACGMTTAARAGLILRCGTVVELRGAGSRHSGAWLCRRVRHVIDATTHAMHFELVRNGWEA